MKASAPATKPADPGQNRKKRLYAAFFLFFGAPPRTPPGALPLDPVGGSAPFRRSQRSLRVAAKAASCNSLAHWASASLLPPLAALGSAPRPLLKKAGENQRENFFGFPWDYAGPPLIGSGGLGSLGGSRGGRAAGCSLRRRKFQRPGGGGGVQGPGPLAPAPEQARCRAQPGSGRVGFAHPPPPPRPLEFPPTPKR